MKTLRFNDTTVRTLGSWEIETYRQRRASIGLAVTIDGPGGERCLSIRARAGHRCVAVARVGWSNLYPWVPVYRRLFGYSGRTTGFEAPYVGAWFTVWLLANRDAHTTSRRFGMPGRRRTMRPEGGFEWNVPGLERRVERIRRDVHAAAAEERDDA